MARWQTTRWSLVRRAADEQGRPGPALEELLKMYHAPILAFFQATCRARGYRVGERYHEDLCQAFCAELMRSTLLPGAEPTEGSQFRNYIKKALKQFVSNDQRWTSARKRGTKQTSALDGEIDDLPDAGPTPDEVFDGEWLAAVVGEALHRTCGTDALLNQLKPYLLEPAEAGGWEAIAKAHGMTPGAVKTRMSRLRADFRERVRAVIGETVGDPQGFENEQTFLRGG